MAKRTVTATTVEALQEWLGEDGRKHFQGYLDEYGTVSPVYSVEIGGGRKMPHPVHFREGMQVRNFMRGLADCEGWTDHDFDDTWADAVAKALQDGGK